MGDTLTGEEFDALLAQFNATAKPPADAKYEIRLHTVGGHFVLQLSGMLLQNVPSEFEQRLAEVYARRPARHAIVDLSQVTYISSAVMGFLHGFFNKCPLIQAADAMPPHGGDEFPCIRRRRIFVTAEYSSRYRREHVQSVSWQRCAGRRSFLG